MIAVNVEITNLDRLRSNFRAAPALTLKYLAKATSAALFEIEKEAVDRNFQFRTPRPLRTGFLAQSFSKGRTIDKSGLRGSIGPTVYYAYDVHRGFSTRGGRLVKYYAPNPYMERIAKAAGPQVDAQFERAAELITDNLAK